MLGPAYGVGRAPCLLAGGDPLEKIALGAWRARPVADEVLSRDMSNVTASLWDRLSRLLTQLTRRYSRFLLKKHSLSHFNSHGTVSVSMYNVIIVSCIFNSFLLPKTHLVAYLFNCYRSSLTDRH